MKEKLYKIFCNIYFELFLICCGAVLLYFVTRGENTTIANISGCGINHRVLFFFFCLTLILFFEINLQIIKHHLHYYNVTFLVFQCVAAFCLIMTGIHVWKGYYPSLKGTLLHIVPFGLFIAIILLLYIWLIIALWKKLDGHNKLKSFVVISGIIFVLAVLGLVINMIVKQTGVLPEVYIIIMGIIYAFVLAVFTRIVDKKYFTDKIIQ